MVHGGSGLVALPATCSTCSCGAATNVACDTTALFFTTSTCGNVAACATAAVTATCAQVKAASACVGSATTSIYIETSSQAAGGSCPASREVATIAPPTWTTSVLGCAPNGSPVSCTAGVCAPNPTGGAFQLCIFQAGDVACPAGAYGTKVLIDTSVSDTRHCTDCACGAPTAKCSGGSASFSPNANCSSGVTNMLPALCTTDGIPATDAYYAELVTVPTPIGAACVPSGGQPGGSATAAGPTTICCQ